LTFLEAVNRVLRSAGIIRGDTDEISTFSDLQHGATLNIAIIAIQDELNDLLSDKLLPYERQSTGTITTSAGTRSYALPSGFIRFFGTPMLYDSTNNVQLFEKKGGEDSLKLTDPNYKTTSGNPVYWYFEPTTTKKISFYPVPDANNAKSYSIDFEGDVSVSSASDTMPFHNNMEGHAFCRMATRRFLYLFENRDMAGLAADPERVSARTVLADLIVGKNPPKQWAPIYR
jgi:hypothetical protein